MAEAFVNRYYGECFEAESAGLEPGKLNPLVIEAMAEDGIDISRNATKSVDDILRAGKTYDYVVTVCDEASAERCPIFPGKGRRLHWGFPDPSQFTGIHAEKLEEVRNVRNAIAARVATWCEAAAGVCDAAR
jgi:arsenate reductase